MPELIAEDFTIPVGTSRTVDETSNGGLAAALLIGYYNGDLANYHEPRVVVRGELHLGKVIGNGTLLSFSSALTWLTAKVENYGLISAVTNDWNARALYAVSSGPDLYNSGTIRAGARADASGYESSKAGQGIINTETGLIEILSGGRALALRLYNGGSVDNAGNIFARVVSGGVQGLPYYGSLGLHFGAGGGAFYPVSIVNSGRIEVEDLDPASLNSIAIYLHGDGVGTITNTGTIRGEYAIWEQSEQTRLPDSAIRIENSGTIEGRVLLDVGDDRIVNSGRIIGDVATGLGNDVYDGRLGTVSGPVRGGDGHDRLLGGSGAEVLIGGAGIDTLSGGDGGDIFVFAALTETRAYGRRSDGKKFVPDLIADFQSGEDKVDLSAIDAIWGTPANDSFTFIGSAAFSNRPGELRFAAGPGGGQLLGDVNGDGIADLHIVVHGEIIVAGDVIL